VSYGVSARGRPRSGLAGGAWSRSLQAPLGRVCSYDLSKSAAALQADANLMKIRVQHEEYKNVFWTYRADQGLWARGRYDDGLNRIVPQGAFKIAEMVYLT
jgi:hypothetical protein